ncbi:hypothetical protein GCM10017786_05870 [Amycolatopsis deserti]|uniref:Uncharacterized protein n=1 Tax=Amycolatopsis deserti TaxID=185696 RepID=A0ABQ3ID62_9PSEU|nr:hypothetical protein GCM10017786_05870 [Amycolatopsis deserti]
MAGAGHTTRTRLPRTYVQRAATCDAHPRGTRVRSAAAAVLCAIGARLPRDAPRLVRRTRGPSAGQAPATGVRPVPAWSISSSSFAWRRWYSATPASLMSS